ncbi:response regulator transcription factor [Chitinilyticum litopenaei]|nr:response regulator transcription factor [Chitinilyticum litopenaei]
MAAAAALTEKQDFAMAVISLSDIDRKNIRAIGALRECRPKMTILVLTENTIHDAELYEELGVAGYAAFGVHALNLGELAGYALREPGGRILLASIGEQGASGSHAGQPPAPVISKKEKEVLELIAKGMRNKEIARELGLAESTIKSHLGQLRKKLGVSNRTKMALHLKNMKD